LSIHQHVQDRLRKELSSLDVDDSPTLDQLESLKYLNNVCREVLRIIPVGILPPPLVLSNISGNDCPTSSEGRPL